VEAVTIDSTFAMAWRRLAQYYQNTGRSGMAQSASVKAYQYADRLNEVERQLTIASYYQIGPAVDHDRALAAYQAALARDSLNFIALNNASLILGSRRELERSLDYRLRAAAQPGTSPISFGNAIAAATAAGRWSLVDSLEQVFRRRFPTNPTGRFRPARTAAVRGEYDRAEQIEREALPSFSSNRGLMQGHLGFMANLALVQGRSGSRSV
jgi:Tfp pilus assembly protein PilF